RSRLARGRVREAAGARGDRGAVMWLHRDAEGGEPRGQLLILAAIERSVRTLHLVAARRHELGEGIHPCPGEAGEMVAKPTIGQRNSPRHLRVITFPSCHALAWGTKSPRQHARREASLDGAGNDAFGL